MMFENGHNVKYFVQILKWSSLNKNILSLNLLFLKNKYKNSWYNRKNNV